MPSPVATRGTPALIGVLRTACHGGPAASLEELGAAAVAWAAETGLGPLLARVVARDPAARASRLWPLVQGVDLTARFLAAQQVEAMAEILDACAGRLRPPVLLKGVSLCERLYPEPHLRPMRDLDVLVEKEATRNVEAILARLGYRQTWTRPRAFYAAHHHSAPFVHPHTGVWVEVHHALFAARSALGEEPAFAADNVRAQLRPCRFRERPARRLSDELHLVHLASHWARGLRVIGGMIAMADAVFLLRDRTALDWGRILAWTRGSPVAGHLRLLLSYLDRHRLVAVPPEVLRTVASRRTPLDRLRLSVAHVLLDRYVADGRPFGPLLGERGFTRLWRLAVLGRPVLHSRDGRTPSAGGHAPGADPPAEGRTTPGDGADARCAGARADAGPVAAPVNGERPAAACPTRCPQVQSRVVGDATAVLDRGRLRIHRLNETAGYVWDRCDGRHTASQIARELAATFDIPADVAERDVAAIVRQLQDANLVELHAHALGPAQP